MRNCWITFRIRLENCIGYLNYRPVSSEIECIRFNKPLYLGGIKSDIRRQIQAIYHYYSTRTHHATHLQKKQVYSTDLSPPEMHRQKIRRDTC